MGFAYIGWMELLGVWGMVGAFAVLPLLGASL